MRILFLFLACSTLFLSACGSISKGKDGQTGLSRTTKASRVIKGLEANAFETKFLEGSARINLKSTKLNIGGTATIRMEKDKAIWMSVKKFGIEGARALIRKDSFFVYNRLQGEYTAEPLSYIEDKYQIPADFELLQRIVLGNAVFFSKDLDLRQEGDIYQLSGSDSRYTTNYVVNGRGFQLQRMSLSENDSDREITISNADFRPVSGAQQDFAFGRSVEINSSASGRANVDLDFKKVTLAGPLQMPFSFR